MYNFYFTFIFYTFESMKIKEYLLSDEREVSLKYVANEMFPGHKSANTYLSVLLKGNNPARQWTESHEDLGRKALHKLGIKLSSL